MLWVKSFHLIFMIAWFAGLFYLPRLFVYHAMTENAAIQQQLKIMEHKLFWVITTPAAILTTYFGIWLIRFYSLDQLKMMGWLHLKLALIICLIIYHISCGVLLRQFKQDRNKRTHRWYRMFNEIPTVLMISIILLAVLRPF